MAQTHPSIFEAARTSGGVRPIRGVGLGQIRAAQNRIAPYVRRTPTMQAWLPCAFRELSSTHLKLENLQVSGGFNVRGVLNLPHAQVQRGLIATSRSAHAVAVAFVGAHLGIPVTIYVPADPDPGLLDTLTQFNATVVQTDQTWSEANGQALAVAHGDGLFYLHPSADSAMVAGLGTIGLEILDAVPTLNILVAAVGFGALLTGIAIAAKAINPAIRIVGVELPPMTGLYESLRRRPRRVNDGRGAGPLSVPVNKGLVPHLVNEVVRVEDQDVVDAAHTLWTELEVSTGLVGAVSTAAILSGKVHVPRGQSVCAVISTTGTEGMF